MAILSDPSPLPLCLVQCLAHDWHQSCICCPFLSPFSLSFWIPHKLQFNYYFFCETLLIQNTSPFRDSHVPCLGLNDRLCPNSFCPGPLCTSERLGVVRSLIDLHGEAAWLLTPWEPWGPHQLSLSISEELLRNLHFANEEHNSQRNDVILPQIPQPVGEQMGVSNPWSTGKIRLEEQPGAKYWPLLQSSTSSAAEVSWRLWTGVRIFSTSLLFTETINNYNQSVYYPENHKGKII